MAVQIITMEDLEQFGKSMIHQMREEIIQAFIDYPPKREEVVWLKSHQVQRMLGIAPSTLRTFRVNGSMPFTKIGGVIFYDKKDVLKMLETYKTNKI